MSDYKQGGYITRSDLYIACPYCGSKNCSFIEKEMVLCVDCQQSFDSFIDSCSSGERYGDLP
mgnify:CR=1 FL=1|jgi:hypothetical protein